MVDSPHAWKSDKRQKCPVRITLRRECKTLGPNRNYPFHKFCIWSSSTVDDTDFYSKNYVPVDDWRGMFLFVWVVFGCFSLGCILFGQRCPATDLSNLNKRSVKKIYFECWFVDVFEQFSRAQHQTWRSHQRSPLTTGTLWFTARPYWLEFQTTLYWHQDPVLALLLGPWLVPQPPTTRACTSSPWVF